MTRRWTEDELSLVLRRLAPADTPESARDPVPALAPGSRVPFNNQRCEQDGHRFDSKAEVRRYQQLLAMVEAGVITDLRVHQEFALHVQSPLGQPIRLGVYVADFTYLRDARRIVEDVKNRMSSTPIYRWKKHHLWAEYGYDVIEIEGPKRKPQAVSM